MKIYLVSLLAGMLVGGIYALLDVRSPAPPVVALLGLLGMLLGEQAITIGKRALRGEALSRAWFAGECVPKITGAAPPGPGPSAASEPSSSPREPHT